MPKSQSHTPRREERQLTSNVSPLRVRTCPGCEGIFKRSQFRRHIRNDCGQMISVRDLRRYLEEEANRTGFQVIRFVDLAWIVQRLVIGRHGPFDLGSEPIDTDQSDALDLTELNAEVAAIEREIADSDASTVPEVDTLATEVAAMDISVGKLFLSSSNLRANCWLRSGM